MLKKELPLNKKETRIMFLDIVKYFNKWNILMTILTEKRNTQYLMQYKVAQLNGIHNPKRNLKVVSFYKRQVTSK